MGNHDSLGLAQLQVGLGRAAGKIRGGKVDQSGENTNAVWWAGVGKEMMASKRASVLLASCGFPEPPRRGQETHQHPGTGGMQLPQPLI